MSPIVDEAGVDPDELDEIVFECIGSRRGVWFYSAWSDAWHLPVGLAWVTRSGDWLGRIVSNVGHVYVLPAVRRKGIARRLLLRILTDSDLLVTPSGSEEGGKALLDSMGFVWDKLAGVWRLRNPVDPRTGVPVS